MRRATTSSASTARRRARRRKPSGGQPRATDCGNHTGWLSEDRGIAIFHWLAVGGAAITVMFTWKLWQVRAEPPMLPLLPLPSFSTGVPLLAALATAALRPGFGLGAYVAVLAYSLATDWTRMQPAMFSFAVLMFARLAGQAGPAIARTHLLSLWFYAGLHKLLSPEFMSNRDPALLRHLPVEPPAWLRTIYPETVVIAEIGLALAAAVPTTRRLAAIWAVILHASILLSISPLGRNWNDSVWAWNAVLGVAGAFLIAPWRSRISACFRAQPFLVRAAIALLTVYPAASQLGVGDPYLAHHLYSRSTPVGYVCRASEPPELRSGLGDLYLTADSRYQCRFVDFIPWLDVPEPAEHAFLRAYFVRTCQSDETLVIRDRRRFFIARGDSITQFPCPDSVTSNQ